MTGVGLYVSRRQHPPASLFVKLGPFGVTLWRDGAVSFQAFGRFVQIVFGDWWQATDRGRS